MLTLSFHDLRPPIRTVHLITDWLPARFIGRIASARYGCPRVPSALSLDGIVVWVGDLGGSAFVAGLSRPTIFCDCRLPSSLSGGQLRIVATT